MDGWVKLYRKTLENPVVCKDGDHLAVWIYLLLNATHEGYQALFNGSKITLLPGQLITGRRSISEKLVISESKIQRILTAFKNEHQIEQQASNRNRLITIVRWDEYQKGEQQNKTPMNTQRTTNEQPVNTNKNVKNDKNVKKHTAVFFSPPTVEHVKAYCMERNSSVDAENFVDFYTAKGWMVGKNEMKDWKAAVRTWEKKNHQSSANQTTREVKREW